MNETRYAEFKDIPLRGAHLRGQGLRARSLQEHTPGTDCTRLGSTQLQRSLAGPCMLAKPGLDVGLSHVERVILVGRSLAWCRRAVGAALGVQAEL